MYYDCNDCEHDHGDCLFCSDVVKNMFKPKQPQEDTDTAETVTELIEEGKNEQ
jgi:hypothetical protein